MDSIRIYKGIPPLTEERLAEIEEMSKMTDDDIDYRNAPKSP